MAADGDLEALYRQHALALLRFSYGLCRNRAEAEDIVSETFARIVTRKPRIIATTARAYLFTVARNVFLDRESRRRREARIAQELVDENFVIDAPLEERERFAKAVHALGALPEGERAALLLRLDHNLSYQEIAQALGISIAAAKVRVHRARLRLAAAHAEESSDP